MKKILSLLLVLILMGCTRTIVEYVEVEVPVVKYKTVTEYIEVEVPIDVPLHIAPERTLVSVDNKYINNYPIYETTFGYCELVLEITFYSTENYYWVQKVRGCKPDKVYTDYYYLLINRVYMPIGKAIEDGYITYEEFDEANLGTKIEK